MLRHALEYAAGGWSIFPLWPHTKAPMTPHGHHDATTDAGQIEAWWLRTPGANIGIACGASGLVVIDIDSREAVQPIRHLLCPTLTASTRPGRWQAYYWVPGDVSIRRQIGRWLHIDICAGDGYVVAPPSIHPETMMPYRWARDMTPARLPLELQEILLADRYAQVVPMRRPDRETSLTGMARAVAATAEGGRNAKLFWAACRAYFEGHGHDAVVAALVPAARAAGLSDAEIMRTIGSARRRIKCE